MLDTLKRPVDVSEHPLLSQSYIVPTPAIAAMYARIRQCLRRGVTGAVIYGHTRWGKTYAVRYCVRLLRHELPRIVVLTLGMPQNPSRSESLFFGMLLDVAQHARPDSGTALQRRLRLYHNSLNLWRAFPATRWSSLSTKRSVWSWSTMSGCVTCRTSLVGAASACSRFSSVSLAS
jgi:hypothetical protein